MPQSLAKLLVHIVFSTKDRTPLIDKTHREPTSRVHGNNFSRSRFARRDHRRSSRSCPRFGLIVPNEIIVRGNQKVKGESSKWIKTKGIPYRRFFWQSGYGAFSVSESQFKIVEKYIREQKLHDDGTTFRNELRGLFRKHGIDYDERYVWD